MRPCSYHVGDLVGPVELLSRAPNDPNGNPVWNVRCRLCGHEHTLFGGYLPRTRTALGCRSCIKEQERQQTWAPGLRVGSLTLTQPATKNGARSSWFARCECGAIDVYRARDLHRVRLLDIQGCSICASVPIETATEVLTFDYGNPTGLKIQQLYLHGLRFTF